MDLRQKLHLVVYRVRERGLEVFVRDEADGLTLPETSGLEADSADVFDREIIALDAVREEGTDIEGIAVEADYHDIPSLKGLLLDDAKRLRARIDELPSAEEGTFVAMKEIAKRVLPSQYRLLQELRDILVDRNSTKYM